MNGLKDFLLELRYRPAMSALIPVDAYMGIPWQMEGGILYIPFFKMVNKNTCMLESEVFIGCPSGKLYGYKRAGKGRCFVFDEGQLLQWKNDWAASGKNTEDSVPAAFASLYKNAVLEYRAAEWLG